MDLTTTSFFESKPKMCSLHKKNEILHVCLNPFCRLKRVLCDVCLREDKIHSSNHHDTIFPINSFVDKLKGLICSDFYENKIKSLAINDYKKTFCDLIDETLQKALDELDSFTNKVLESVKKKKDSLIEISNQQKDHFINSIHAYEEILKKGEKYEAKLCNMITEYNQLMGNFIQIEKIENDEAFEQQLLSFSKTLYHTINYKNTFQEERSKVEVKNYLKKFESAISNPPDIVINPKIYDVVKTIETKIYLQNLIDEVISFRSINTLNDLFNDDIKIYPDYFYGFNTKYSCLYIHEGDKILSAKLSENQNNAQIVSTEIKNYVYVMKDLTCCNITVLPEGRIFLCGGYSDHKNTTSNGFFELNLETCKVIKLQSMINDRYYHGTCYIDNKIYAICGKTIGLKKDESLSACEYYDLNLGKWFPIFPSKVESHHSAICSFGKEYIYKIGGFKKSQPINTIERYSILRNKWDILEVEGLGNLNFIAQAEAIQINKNTIMIFGGAATLRNSPYMGINLFLKLIDDSDNSIAPANEIKHEISMNSKYQLGSAVFFSSPKKCVVHDFAVYALTNSHHLLKFDGFGWLELV